MPKHPHTAKPKQSSPVAPDSPQEDISALLTRLQEHLQDLFYRTDAQGKIIWGTQAINPLLGYDPDELIGVKLSTLYEDPGERDHFLALLKKQGAMSLITALECGTRMVLSYGSPPMPTLSMVKTGPSRGLKEQHETLPSSKRLNRPSETVSRNFAPWPKPQQAPSLSTRRNSYTSTQHWNN